MSIFKTALVTALLASSTAAMAAPGVSSSADASFSFATSSPVVRDHRSHDRPYSMPTHTNWSSLSGPLQLGTGTDIIRLQGRQALSQIRIQVATGNMDIDRVIVRFSDGTRQNVRLNTRISTTNPMIQFDVAANRGVDTISITGRGSRRVSYQVFAQGASQRSISTFTGTYTSAYGDVFLKQVGNRIHGEYSAKQGTIVGYVRNGVAIVKWSEPSGSGGATFSLGAGNNLEGTWGNGTSTNNAGEWDLVRANR